MEFNGDIINLHNLTVQKLFSLILEVSYSRKTIEALVKSLVDNEILVERGTFWNLEKPFDEGNITFEKKGWDEEYLYSKILLLAKTSTKNEIGEVRYNAGLLLHIDEVVRYILQKKRMKAAIKSIVTTTLWVGGTFVALFLIERLMRRTGGEDEVSLDEPFSDEEA